ncbi:uncharacterized protein EURHEDRAFT_403883 [Aspergillus ruber CBS 135680]|uniref:Uncharacterized protein n=1 Tax=Aspergillus ruber (strain CBS 135680) TaxID=1388766 RepID=A0A017SB02_ASPRC|nr:uncharacterized protein EURHEDRAFT_403883 [Aspergillus ruber CBS 135680]EYE93819.1 hypothetical protein EURHEDRAFT_403883 [Aspergillus ruber CBS 135680]
MRMNYRRVQFEPKPFFPTHNFTPTFPPRRFTPQLIETARRSFRRDTSYDRYHSDPPELQAEDTYIDTVGDQSSCSSLGHRDIQKIYPVNISSLSEITSDYSGGSSGLGLPSLSSSASTNDSINKPKLEEQRRESCDEQFSAYLLSLAAQSTNKQLKEQMFAAFPDEQVSQNISHSSIDTSYNENPVRYIEKKRVVTSHGTPSDDLRKFQHICRQHMGETKSKGLAMVEAKEGGTSTAVHQVIDTVREFQDDHGDWQSRATVTCPTSPPLLGNDIVFPRSLSPERTINDIGNATRHQRINLDQPCRDHGGLWSADLNVGDNRGDGLWMGTCRRASESDRNLHKLILTESIIPVRGHKDESSASSDVTSEYGDRHPFDPFIRHKCTDNVDRKLNPQDEFNEEIHDGFVTQIYNYLSLGYPCVAHCYDHELSRISSISVNDLRKDDFHTDSKGYVGVIEGTSGSIWSTGQTCMRWLALRVYIQKWTRQQPWVAEDDSDIIEAWGEWEY